MAMDETELIKIAVFKVAETAKRMESLAGAARSLEGRRLLAAVARLLAEHEQELRTCLERSEATRSGQIEPTDRPTTKPRRTTAAKRRPSISRLNAPGVPPTRPRVSPN